MSSDDPSPDSSNPEFEAQAFLRRAVERHRLGDLDRAIELYRRALDSGAIRNADVASEAQRLLGFALRAAGDPDAALSALDQALQLASNESAAVLDPIRIERSAALQDCGRSKDAIAGLNSVSEPTLDAPLVQAVLADAYRALGRPDIAAPHYQRLVDLTPSPENFVNLGACQQENGDLDGAIVQYQTAIERDADYGPASTNLGLALLETGALADAVAPLERGVELDPKDALALNGLGAVYLRLGRENDAENALTHALDNAPDHAPAWSNLGNLRQDQRRLEEAFDAHDKAVALEPDNPELHWNRAMTRLLSGDLARGFEEYEWRSQTRNHAPPMHGSPRWDGGPLSGKHILLMAEQGFGDMIQFARYAPLLAARGADVTLTCSPKLAALFQTLGDDITVVTKISAARHIDCHAPLMSVPYLCETTLESIPGDTPYLTPPPAARRRQTNDDESGCAGPAIPAIQTTLTGPARWTPLRRSSTLRGLNGLISSLARTPRRKAANTA
ncbi:MAG: tetratricopeptide (TPR) repeat protein [Alphaproteobacteria bacterium]|jgi:tetratricopeptide (TPR) repeat protein